MPGCSKRAEKIMPHDGDSDINHNWSTSNNSKSPEKEIDGTGYHRKD